MEQYLALDYRYDVAYFIDVLMTPEQLAAFIAQHHKSEHLNDLEYALAIRYLSDRKWNQAREVLASVKTLGRGVDDRHNDSGYGSEWPKRDKDTDKSDSGDPEVPGIRLQWVEQDLRTANDLERLEHAVDAANGDEAKAEALYQVASYQFERSLLFYNPVAWGSIRHYLLELLDEQGLYRRPGEAELLFDYQQKHDMAANSLPIYLEVVRRFPKTRAARDAFYTAAVCHDRLREYNSYWREIYSEGNHAGPMMVTYADVKRAYPDYHFPIGTLGWEPATRTVRGGAGWDTLPRFTTPRPSRWQRIKPYLDRFENDSRRAAQTLYDLLTSQFLTTFNWFYHLGCALFAAFGLWFVGSNVGESQSQLVNALLRCQPRPHEEVSERERLVELSPFAIVANKYLRSDLRDEWIERGSDLMYKLRQLERPGRSALVRTVTAYFLSFLLLVALISHAAEL